MLEFFALSLHYVILDRARLSHAEVPAATPWSRRSFTTCRSGSHWRGLGLS